MQNEAGGGQHPDHTRPLSELSRFTVTELDLEERLALCFKVRACWCIT